MSKTCTLTFNGITRTCYIYHYGQQRTRLEDVLTAQETHCLMHQDFIAVSENGGILDWSSPLEDGENITIRPLELNDMKIFKVPLNKDGNCFSFEDALKIRSYEQEHGTVWNMSLEEIKLILAK